MAEYNRGGLDSKALAERKNKRLQEALSAYTPEQTKETVSKLLEEYVDESGKNYFGAGTRDTTLYFADDEYIREIEKEKNKDRKKEKKSSVVNKLHKLTSIIPKSEHSEENKAEESSSDTSPSESSVAKHRNHDLGSYKKAESGHSSEDTDKIYTKEKTENIISETEPDISGTETNQEIEKADDVSEPTTVITPVKVTDQQVPDKAEPADVPSPEPEVPHKEAKIDAEAEAVASKEPEPEPTIVIEPVKEDDIKSQTPAKEGTNEMRREFFDNEIEVEEVPRRRRKPVDPEKPEKEKSAPKVTIDDEDEDDSFSEDTEAGEKEKKSKFGNFFKRKKSDPFDDNFDDDDDEFDDDDYFDDDDDDDDYDYEEGITFKKVLNVVVIIALICSTAFFAASNYSNLKKLESANTQINELNNGSSGSSDEEINELKTQISTLTAENERLKSSAGSASDTSEPTSAAATTSAATSTETSDSSTSAGSGSTYTIQPGDTGSKICTAVYGQYTEELWQKILDANGMTSSTVYHPGDVLQIP